MSIIYVCLLIVLASSIFNVFAGIRRFLQIRKGVPTSKGLATAQMGLGAFLTIISLCVLIDGNQGETIPIAFLFLIAIIAFDALNVYRDKTKVLRLGPLTMRIVAMVVLAAMIIVNGAGPWAALASSFSSSKAKASASSNSGNTVSGDATSENDVSKNAKSGKKAKVNEDEVLERITVAQAERDENFGMVNWTPQKDAWPSNATERVSAIKNAGGPTFTGPVSVPFRNIENLKNFSKLSDEQKEATLQAAWNEVEEKIIRDPIYGHMWLQFFAEFEYITYNNSWITRELKKLDKALLEEQGGKGWDEYCLVAYKVSENVSKIKITEYWYKLAARIVFTLRHFDVTTVEKRTSEVNWENLGKGGDASYVRTTKADKQEHELAIIMRMIDKGGNERILAGINIWDKRAEIFGEHLAITVPAPKGTKAKSGTPTDPPKTTGTPPGNSPTPTGNPPGGSPTPTPTDNPPDVPPTDTPGPNNPVKDPADSSQSNGRLPVGGGTGNGQPVDGQPTQAPVQDHVNPTGAPPATEAPPPPPVDNGGDFDSGGGGNDVDPGGNDVWQETIGGGDTTNVTDVTPGGAGHNGFVDW